MSEDETCGIRQIRAYADEYVIDLEDEIHSDLINDITKCLISNAIEDAVKWALSHPKNKK